MKALADRRQRRARRIGFWVAVAAIVGYLFFVGDQRPHHLLLLWLEERRAEERIATLEAERRDLAAEAERLSSDSLALEALARQKGMVRPGDLVYRIVPVPPDVRQAAAESLAARAARLAADSLAAAHEAESRRARPRPASPSQRPDPDAARGTEDEAGDGPGPGAGATPVDGPEETPDPRSPSDAEAPTSEARTGPGSPPG